MKLLIADDEDYTREGLMEDIPWKEYGFTEIMQAHDGEMALKISRWFRPDVILTDIRMPRLDGIQFVKEISKIMDHFKLIFMSGYLETEYLKSAIELDAVSYVEKPIDIEKLKKAIEKSVSDLNNYQEKMQMSDEQADLKRKRLAKILIYKNSDKDTIVKLCDDIDFPQKESYMAILFKERDVIEKPQENIKHILNYFCARKNECVCDYIGDRLYSLVIAFHQKTQEKIQGEVRSFSGMNPQFSVAVGVQISDLNHVYTSFDAAVLALNQEFYHKEQHFFTLSNQMLVHKSLSPNTYVDFIHAYEKGPEELSEWLASFFDQIKQLEAYRKEQVQEIILSFSLAILKEHHELYYKLDGVFNESDLQLVIQGAESIDELVSIMDKLVNGLSEYKDTRKKYSLITRTVLDYVANHYQEEEFRVQTLADYLHFSTTYLNVLFKNEMGVSLKQYICTYRIEQAKKLLANEFYKISEISSLCGYASSNYFAKAFKEETGCTPAEYRQQVNEL